MRAVAMGKFFVFPGGAQRSARVVASGCFHFQIPYCPLYVGRAFARSLPVVRSTDRVFICGPMELPNTFFGILLGNE
jgi:hypothetical protein